jgi:O-antigen/teichoic acid export membrane protein
MRTLRFFTFNLLGQVLPILAALVSVPIIAHHAGVDRLGALGVIWALIGYFGFLDFGLSRVVTRRVALAVEYGRLPEELGDLRVFFWVIVTPALVSIGFLLDASHVLAAGVLPDGAIGREIADSWSWIAWSIPVTLATNWLRGALEGVQRFARVSLLRTAFGTLNYAAPAIAVLYQPTLTAIIISIVISRSFSLAAHAIACMPSERAILVGRIASRPKNMRKFFNEGGWMTVSNLIGPLLVISDRFVLAALVSPKAVAWYVTAQEAILRTSIIPGALAGVLFPKFAGASTFAPKPDEVALYQQGIRIVAAIMLPLCAFGSAVAYDAMRLWMGSEFAINSYALLEIMILGIYINAISFIPFAWLQATGRSDLTAKIHMIELPVYAAAIYFSATQWGILGAAWVWTLRLMVDCALLSWTAIKIYVARALFIGLSGVVMNIVIILATSPESDQSWRAMIVVGSILFSVAYVWCAVLNKSDRALVKAYAGQTFSMFNKRKAHRSFH